MADTIAGGVDAQRPYPPQRATTSRLGAAEYVIVKDNSAALNRQRQSTAEETGQRAKTADDARMSRRSGQYAAAHAKRRGSR